MKKMSPFKTLLIAGIVLLVSCEKEDIETTVSLEDNPELFVSDAPVEQIDFNGLELLVQERNGVYVHQGDIMIPELKPVTIYESKKDIPQFKATSTVNNLWDGGKVYYTIDPSLPNQQRVHDAIKYWESVSSLQFINSKNGQGYIYFTPGAACSSYLGRTGYKQDIILARGCTTGITVHEIGHALGLWHEQSRSDRDEYVTIHWENISSGMGHNFRTYKSMRQEGQELNDELDIESIMMYGSYSFSSNGKPTITTKSGATFRANRTYLSEHDIAGINKLYAENPEYENGNYYVIENVTVYRDWNRWWYFTWKSGWKEVKLSPTGHWYYV